MKQTNTGFKKPIRTGERVVQAQSIKPLQHIPGVTEEEDQCFACFVDSKNAEQRIPCSLGAARRIQGGKPRNPKAYYGLDNQQDRHYLIHIADIKGVSTVVGVDVYPRIDSGAPRPRATDDDSPEVVTLQINQATGDIDVTEFPRGMAAALLMRILGKIDSLAQLDVGQVLPSNYVITEVAGGRITIEPQ